jgi:hypothetical protein
LSIDGRPCMSMSIASSASERAAHVCRYIVNTVGELLRCRESTP